MCRSSKPEFHPAHQIGQHPAGSLSCRKAQLSTNLGCHSPRAAGFFAEDPSARARRIHQHAVESGPEMIRQIGREISLVISNIARTPTLDISCQIAHPFGMISFATSKSLSLHQRGDMGSFSTGGSRQIKDALAWLGSQQLSHSLGSGVLQIVKTCCVIGMLTGRESGETVKPAGIQGMGVSGFRAYTGTNFSGVSFRVLTRKPTLGG